MKKMKNCLKKLLHQAYEQYTYGDDFTKGNYDLYVNTLVNKEKEPELHSQMIKYWEKLKREEWKDDELKVNENIQRDDEILRELGYKR